MSNSPLSVALLALGGGLLSIAAGKLDQIRNHRDEEQLPPPVPIPEDLLAEDPEPISAKVRDAFQERQIQRHEALKQVIEELQRRKRDATLGDGEDAPLEGRTTAIDVPQSEYHESPEDQQIRMLIETFSVLVAEQEAELHVTPNEIASCFCPLTQCMMTDPVSTVDGHTYEREAIEQWLRRRSTSPLTNLRLERKDLVPNMERRMLIQRVLRANIRGDGSIYPPSTDLSLHSTHRVHLRKPHVALEICSLAVQEEKLPPAPSGVGGTPIAIKKLLSVFPLTFFFTTHILLYSSLAMGHTESRGSVSQTRGGVRGHVDPARSLHRPQTHMRRWRRAATSPLHDADSAAGYQERREGSSPLHIIHSSPRAQRMAPRFAYSGSSSSRAPTREAPVHVDSHHLHHFLSLLRCEQLAAAFGQPTTPVAPPPPPTTTSPLQPIDVPPVLLDASIADVRRMLQDREEDRLLRYGVFSSHPSALVHRRLHENVPRCFCPISQSLLSDPVMTADGQTYERGAIQRWLLDHDTSPVTNLPLPTKAVRINNEVRELVEALLQYLERTSTCSGSPSSTPSLPSVPDTEGRVWSSSTLSFYSVVGSSGTPSERSNSTGEVVAMERRGNEVVELGHHLHDYFYPYEPLSRDGNAVGAGNAVVSAAERQAEVRVGAAFIPIPQALREASSESLQQHLLIASQHRQANRFEMLHSFMQRDLDERELNCMLEEFSCAAAVVDAQYRVELSDVDRCICPITQCLMSNPVQASDGFTYEASAILQWFEHHSTSPTTSLRLPDKSLAPNPVVRELVEKILKNFR
eukprot:gene1194-710_t